MGDLMISRSRASRRDEFLHEFFPPVIIAFGTVGICAAIAVATVGASLADVVLCVAASSLTIFAGVVVHRVSRPQRYSLLWGPLDRNGRPKMFRGTVHADEKLLARLRHYVAAKQRHGHAFSQSKPQRVNAARAFAWFAILAPRRVWQEETGDALETIAAMEAAGCSAFKIRLKVWSTILWVMLNGLRETVAALTGRKSPHK